MSIPLSIFYFIYLIFVLVFIAYSLFNLYHLIRFGGKNIAALVIAAFYTLFSILILIICWHYIGAINWHASLEILPALPTTL